MCSLMQFGSRIEIFFKSLTKTLFVWTFRLKYYNLLQHKWLTNANECFKRAAETSLGIAKGLVSVRNVNVFINGIRFAD